MILRARYVLPMDQPPIEDGAVAIEGDKPRETFAGGLYAVPVASAVLRKYFEKQRAGAAPSAPPAGPS